MTLTAYKYTTERTHIEHLRVKQSQYSDGAKERLKRIGSPARWIPARGLIPAWSLIPAFPPIRGPE